MKKHILCLGDSNTHGYCADPSDCADSVARFNEDERWTCLLQKALGEGYLVTEEGLSGRTTVFQDALHESMDALSVIYALLKSHEIIDLLIIMLGTNDVKQRLGGNAHAIALGMRRLIQKAQTTDCWGKGKPNILVIAPLPIDKRMEQSPVADEMGLGAVEKSRELPAHLERMAAENGVHFLNAETLGLAYNHIDFMHLTRESHAKLAAALAEMVRELT